MTTFVAKTNADLSEFSDSNDEFLKALREKIDAADGDEESKINDDDGDNVTETKNYSMLTLFTSSREMTLISANVCFQEKFKHMIFFKLLRYITLSFMTSNESYLPRTVNR